MATNELLEIGLGQRLCVLIQKLPFLTTVSSQKTRQASPNFLRLESRLASVPVSEELQDVGTPSVNCFNVEIGGSSKGTIASGFQSTPETMDMRGQHNEYFQSRSYRHRRRHHPPTGAGRADLRLQDLVPLRQENNAGRQFKQSRLCRNGRQQAIRVLIRASVYNELDDNATNLFDQDTVPLPLSVPTRCRGYTVLVYLPRPLQIALKRYVHSIGFMRTEAHEPPEYLGLTQDILQHPYWEVTDIIGQGGHENPDVYIVYTEDAEVELV
ncbi:hypothetical protein BKA70DRAFT_1223089 [Coprinopsis sp. MPI-PUGE-AT-0042]|nr:hypothetical protein BKA70DRAFT_1223089 [Coprinopsis sp. MPI-PUGE-AT-0042]